MTARLDWTSVLAWRVRRQHLAERAPGGAALDVVADLAGVHAQLASSAELTLWARVESLPRGFVDRALWEDRTLVKTWAMRGTLHVLPTHELAAWVAAQGALPARYERPSWLRAFGLAREEADALLAAIPRALEGRMLTREELAREVGRLTSPAVGDKLRDGWGALLKPSAFRGDICFAPNDGRAVRFARPRDWLGDWEELPTDAGVAEVVRRYLGAYGPATREDFARWFGASSPAQAERMIRSVGDDVTQVDVDGTAAWALAASVEEIAGADPLGVVRLLPAFDHYVVAAPRDNEAVLAAEHRPRVYRPQGWLSPVVLVDGRITGIWKHERKSRRIEVLVEPFARLAKREREGVEAEAERLAGFLDGDLALRWG